MIAVSLVLGALGLVAVTVLLTWSLMGPSLGPVLRKRLRREVVVTTKSGRSFRGLMVESDSRALVLRNAQALTAEGGHVLVDGELIVAKADIDYLQLP